MNEVHSVQETIEAHLGETAAALAYPPTPDIVAAERRRLAVDRPPGRRSRTAIGRPARLLGGALAAVLLLLAIALAVPQTRAALLQIFEVGAVRILVDEETPAPVITPARTLLDVAGATTLVQAADMVDFDILLPAYPADLGPPDQVYVQKLADTGLDGPIAILVWLDPTRPGEARLSLYQIPVPSYAFKWASMESVRETEVDGQRAFWVRGPHRLKLQNGDYDEWLFVPGTVLLWSDGRLTYRLESGLSMAEAVRIAESLRPLE